MIREKPPAFAVESPRVMVRRFGARFASMKTLARIAASLAVAVGVTAAASLLPREDGFFIAAAIVTTLGFAMALIALLLIAGLSERLRRRQPAARPGTVLAFAAGAYGAVRAVLELVRADSKRILGGTTTVWQLAALVLLGGAGAWAALGCARRRVHRA